MDSVNDIVERPELVSQTANSAAATNMTMMNKPSRK
jgi:hypothetical protein